MRRRTVLAASGSLFAALAGCTSDGSGANRGRSTSDSSPGSGERGDDGRTPTATAAVDESLAGAPIARDLDEQPHLGPHPRDAESVIVEVTDPSCPTCRAFHQQAFPEVVDGLVDPGKTSFVVRNVDWVYSWAPTASAALEATHDRAPDAYWELLSKYFAEQAELSTDNVRSLTEGYLSDTTVDAGTVVDAVEAGEYDAAVAADVEAARDAGVSGQPYFFLFRDGTLRTSFRGAQSYAVFRNGLGY